MKDRIINNHAGSHDINSQQCQLMMSCWNRYALLEQQMIIYFNIKRDFEVFFHSKRFLDELT